MNTTETPLNARQWLKENPRSLRCNCGDCETWQLEHDVIVSPVMDEYARAVLAEAERALRERAKRVVAPQDSDWKNGVQYGVKLAADLLAGMRGE